MEDWLFQGDCLEEMQGLKSGSVDMVLADLPYGTTACKWDTRIPFEPLWEQFHRVCKPNAALAMFGSEPFSSLMRMSNLKRFKYDWVWLKSNGGGFLNANRQPLKRHELVSVFSCKQTSYYPQKTSGKKYRCTRASAGETTQDQTVAGWVTENDGSRFPLSYQKVSSETGFHPTQKPVVLLEYLIKTYTKEGDTVLDPTMGSGSTGVACKNLKRNFIGIELNPEYYKIALRRIRNG